MTLKKLFKRFRRPGDLVFACAFLLLSLFLLSQLGEQTVWKKRTNLFAQPAFWPAISIISMSIFSCLHWISSIMSPKILGRWTEVAFWLRSVEFAIWFMVYVILVPRLGYLPVTVVFAMFLAVRLGYRSLKMIGFSALAAVVVVVIFKSLLQVKVPGGEIYEFLPTGLRAFMLTYF